MRRVKRATHKPNLKMDALAQSMLDQAEKIFQQSASLDTAVRDVVSEGLARLVYAAYDTRGCAQLISDFDFRDYIEEQTYKWFRDHGYVEWFCRGAAVLFRTSERQFFRSLQWRRLPLKRKKAA
jgi:hypothetical protein